MNPFDKLRFERDEAIKERDDLQDRTDEEWLNEIGGQWLKLTGQPWETRDGETREEGLQANIAALFQVIETLTKERDEAQKKCAVKDKALESALAAVWDGHYSGKGVAVEYARAVDAEVKHALSSDCGNGFISVKELEPTIGLLNALLEVTHDFLDGENGLWTKLAEDEKSRLETLIQNAK